MVSAPYKRVLLKISGEALRGGQNFGVDFDACRKIAEQVNELRQAGVQTGVVIGGGNLFRGKQAGIDRTPADQIGILATLINGLALQQAFESAHCPCRVLSAIACESMVEFYTWKKALHYLDGGHVVIFVGGTGNPYFTTDSAAALRALEIGAEVLFKATKVDGVYDKDPAKYSDAVRFQRISYSEVLAKQLGVMDATAIALCRENRLPIHVINLFADHALRRAVFREKIGTLVEGE